MYIILVLLFMFFFTLLPFFWAGWLSSIPFVRYINENIEVRNRAQKSQYIQHNKQVSILITTDQHIVSSVPLNISMADEWRSSVCRQTHSCQPLAQGLTHPPDDTAYALVIGQFFIYSLANNN
jgi:hypothetical protein